MKSECCEHGIVYTVGIALSIFMYGVYKGMTFLSVFVEPWFGKHSKMVVFVSIVALIYGIGFTVMVSDKTARENRENNLNK